MGLQMSCRGRHWLCGQVLGAHLGTVMTVKPWPAPAATAGADAQQCVGNSPLTSLITAVACVWQQAGQQHGSQLQAALTCRSPAGTPLAHCTVRGRMPHALDHTIRRPVHPAGKGTCRRRPHSGPVCSGTAVGPQCRWMYQARTSGPSRLPLCQSDQRVLPAQLNS